MLSCIQRHNYLCYYLFFVFFIELCAWGKLYSGTPGMIIDDTFEPGESSVAKEFEYLLFNSYNFWTFELFYPLALLCYVTLSCAVLC